MDYNKIGGPSNIPPERSQIPQDLKSAFKDAISTNPVLAKSSKGGFDQLEMAPGLSGKDLKTVKQTVADIDKIVGEPGHSAQFDNDMKKLAKALHVSDPDKA